MQMRKKVWGVALLGLAMQVGAWAQEDTTWPPATVTLVVGYGPGGTTDIFARALAEQLRQATGKTFVVENKAGANSNIGAEWVTRAKKDGSVLYVATTANTINNSLYKNLRFDVRRDFQPVAKIAGVPNLLVVNSKSKMQTIKDYLQTAKAQPDELTCASSGIGSAVHMSCELFKIETGTKIRHIPYKGSADAMTDLLGGQVDSAFDNMPTVSSNVQAGSLRGLAVTTAVRSKLFPNIPTVAESIGKDFSVEAWFGVFAPAGVHAKVMEQMNADINKALQSPGLIKKLEDKGAMLPTAQANTVAGYTKFVHSELDKWKSVVNTLNLEMN